MREDLRVAEMPPQFAVDELRVAPRFLIIAARLVERAAHPLGSDPQVFDKRLHVRPDMPGRSEVGQEQRLGIPGFDTSRTLDPELDVDVWWWRRRPDVIAGDADARHVAHERDAAGSIEEADMVRGMSWRVADLEGPSSNIDSAWRVRKDERHDIRRRHGRNLTPQALHLITPQPLCASHEPRGIDQVRCAALVHEDLHRAVSPY
jgi:hypothetical protein